MLSEFFEYIRSSAPKVVKDLGYVYSSIALEKRARRQVKDWSSHIKNCHNLWKQLLENKSYKTIAVLGSGPLTELPIKFLIENCEELHLVDIVQPRSVKKKWSNHPKVILHESDITGFVRNSEMPNIDFAVPKAEFKADLVVSANLMSQLSLEPGWHLTKKFNIQEDDALYQNMIQKILKDHLVHLKSYGAKKVILYTDTERQYFSPNAELLETHASRVLSEVELGKSIKHWQWSLCPLGEESKDYEIRMKVEAYEL